METTIEWSFNKPTEEGYYMINSGDVVTDNNMEPVFIFYIDTRLFVRDFRGEVFPLSNLHSSFKFLNISQLSKQIDP